MKTYLETMERKVSRLVTSISELVQSQNTPTPVISITGAPRNSPNDENIVEVDATLKAESKIHP